MRTYADGILWAVMTRRSMDAERAARFSHSIYRAFSLSHEVPVQQVFEDMKAMEADIEAYERVKPLMKEYDGLWMG